MKANVQISRGVESLFGTRDENIRLIESGLKVNTQLIDNLLEIEGDADAVSRAENILEEYVALVREGHVFNNGDLNSYLRVVTEDPEVSFRALVQSGRQRNFGKKVLAPKTVNQRRYLEAIERNDLVLGVGPAGTGKTYLAVAMAISALLSKRVARIILTRPAVEAGERLGFLPGTLQEKVDPYLRPMYDALADLMSYDKMRRYIELGVIEIAPLAFMRGRTLHNSFVILDEAQNTTVRQMKMFLTRMGVNSRAVITGDITQIDLKDPDSSGLVRIQQILGHVPDIRFIYFHPEDVVRHRLVRDIIRAFDDYHTRMNGGSEDGVGTSLDPDAPAVENGAPAGEAPAPDSRGASAPDEESRGSSR